MKREDLEKMAAQVVALVAKETAGEIPKPGTPQREMMDLGIKLAVDTLSLLDRAVGALEIIAESSSTPQFTAKELESIASWRDRAEAEFGISDDPVDEMASAKINKALAS